MKTTRAAAAKGAGNVETTKKTEREGFELPPDPENKNDDRAEWADKAIKAFVRATGCDQDEALGDLLADLGHWCDRNNFDFVSALRRAAIYYTDETAGEGEQMTELR